MLRAIIFLLISSFAICATPQSPQTTVMSKAEFIEKILSQQHYLAKDEIYLDIKKLELDASFDSYTNFAPEIEMALEHGHYKIKKDTDSNYIYEQKRKTDNQKISLTAQKKFIDHRGYFSFKASRALPSDDITRYKRDDFYNFYEVDTYDNTYAISYTYPLLKDSNGASLKTYKRNILDLEREQLDYLDNKEEMVVERLEDYIEFIEFQEKSRICKEYQALLMHTDIVDDKGLITELYLADKNVTTYDAKLSAAQHKLATFTTDDNFLTTRLEVEYNVSANIVNDINKYLRQSSRSLRKLEIDEKLKQIDITYYENRQLSTLDFKITAEKNTNIGNTLTTQYDNKSMDYASSIVYSTALFGDINNTKNLAVARLNLEKLRIDYNDKLTDVLADVSSYVANIIQAEKSLATYPKFIKKVSENAQHSRAQFTQNFITLKDLIDVYKQLRDIQLDYIDVLIEHREYLLKYDDALDRIVY